MVNCFVSLKYFFAFYSKGYNLDFLIPGGIIIHGMFWMSGKSDFQLNSL